MSRAPVIPVCVFAKPPVPGQVKTRLIPALGEHASAALASAMFTDVWRTVSSCPAARPILATVSEGVFPCTIPGEAVWLQGDGDLGARIERILARALADAPAAIAVGADSPLLTTAHLAQTMDALRVHDAVIGRCEDGGFYLLGMRRCPPGLFSDLPWSCAATAAALECRLHQFGFSVCELEPLFDVDVPEDLARLRSALEMQSSAAPSTRAWCSRYAVRES
jgi:uncharacterized protein